jgi:exodeoxyribonuclease VIII
MHETTIPVGLHANVPETIYHRRVLGLASKSALDEVHRSPAHYRLWVDGTGERDTPALAFGRAFHCAVLEPVRFQETYVVEPDFGDCRKTENRRERDRWREENGSKRLLSADQMADIAGMSASIRAHKLASRMIDGIHEATICWEDGATGLKCKGRMDVYNRKLGLVVDVKTALDASPREFAKAVNTHRYHVQDAMYREGLRALKLPVDHFVFLVVEKSPPYAVALYELDDKAGGRGYQTMHLDLGTLSDALEHDSWPGYSETIQTIDLPPWAE